MSQSPPRPTLIQSPWIPLLATWTPPLVTSPGAYGPGLTMEPNPMVSWFLPDGGNGARQGSWRLKNGETVLEAEFNGVLLLHGFEYVAREKKAVLRNPLS